MAKRALRAAADLAACEERETIMRADHDGALAEAESRVAAERLRADRLSRLLDEVVAPPLPERPWYEHPAFVASVSAVGAAAVVLLSVWAAGSL